ncbi:ABC transporter permease [Nodularia harveyana UHCC-0300]|uniref:ABC transporter permease n=1 Tax=Nodularia harveyana UHCC-0300 TaxID=2974287 RepID=A0ABU5UKK3_9CYAN|nr:ABC transporter permease [Nodularia harveyana]MEA5583620.1 ABC transporter permease [Nodularia harveyana UHCC-0300]
MGNQVVIIVGTFILLITGLLFGYVLSQLVLGFLAFNLLTILGTFSLFLIFCTLCYVLFWQLKREQPQIVPQSRQQQARTQLTPPTPAPAIPTPTPTPPTPAPAPAIPDDQLKNQLITKLGGDVAAAERLIEQAKVNYPDMSESWYCERVIDDLERDQR